MSRLGKMRENMYSNMNRHDLRMDKLAKRSVEENEAEYKRLKSIKRGLKNCERNRLSRLERVMS
jgi:hypothetical protein